VFFGRWFPYLTTYSGYIHAFVGTLVLVMTCTAVTTMSVFMMGGTIDFSVKHFKEGWSVVFILVFFIITGFMAFYAKKIFKWNSKAIRIFRWVHRLVAYAMYGLVIATLFTGMKMHEDHLLAINLKEKSQFWKELKLVTLYLMFGLVVVFELLFRFNKSRYTDFNTPNLKEVIDEKTFEKRVLEG